MKIGYFWKIIYNTDEYTIYRGENIYKGYPDMIYALIESVRNKRNSDSYYNEMREEITNKASMCKDALAVCASIKKSLSDYEETCDLEIDICFTHVF